MEKIILLAFLSCCVWWDIREGKIPNRVILFGIAAFFGGCFIRGPSQWDGAGGICFELLLFSGRIILTTAILFPLFLFRMMGAGDIKVMAVLTGWMGWHDGYEIIFYGLAAGAAWSFVYMLYKRILIKRFKVFLGYLLRIFQTKQILPYYCAANDVDGAGFCFAPFLWCGYGLWLAVQGGFL